MDPPKSGDNLSAKNGDNDERFTETRSPSNEIHQRVEPRAITDVFEIGENSRNNQQIPFGEFQEESHHNDKHEEIGGINDVEHRLNHQTSIAQPLDEELNNMGISGIRIIEDFPSSGENIYDRESVTPPPQIHNTTRPMNSNNIVHQNSGRPSSSATPPTTTSINNTASSGRRLDENFEDFLKNFLEKDAKDLDSYEIRSFTAKTPRNYRPLPSQFPLIFEALYKIKTIENRAIYNDSLSLLNKVFEGMDINSFLVRFWKELKSRGIGPIGYSFTDGQSKFNYIGVKSDHNAPPLLSEKTTELAWSLLLDLDATMKSILQVCVYESSYIVFHFCILRRLSCLGEFMIDVDGKDTPIFIYYIRNLLNDPEIQANQRLYEISLSLLVSVAWSPRGLHCWSLISPNIVLNEVMANLVKKDQFFLSWFKALKELFYPLEQFSCMIKWKDDTIGFDNPGVFLRGFVQCLKHGNSAEIKENLFDILRTFKKTVSAYRVPIRLSNFDDVSDMDWLTAYFITNEAELRDFKHAIPAALFKALPANSLEKYTALENTEESLDQALISIFELFFTIGTNISTELYKYVWQAYPQPPSVIDTVARCIVTAINNLKVNQAIHMDRNFRNMVMEICAWMDKSFLDSMSSFMEIDSQFVFECQHIFIIGRVLRRMIESELGRQKRVVFKELGYYVQDIFRLLVNVVTDKFNEFRDKHFNSWPPWRRDRDAFIDDKTLMSICYALDIIQKDAFCIYGMTYDDLDIMEYLFFLYKKRKIVGINYSKANEQIGQLYPMQHDHQENESRNAYRGGYDTFHGQNRRNPSGRDTIFGRDDYTNGRSYSTNADGNSSYANRGTNYRGPR